MVTKRTRVRSGNCRRPGFQRILFCLIATIAGQNVVFADPGSPFSVKKLGDVAYVQRDGKSSLCDVFLPERPATALATAPNERFPVVVSVHGGAWMSGDKWTMGKHSQALAERGIAVVSINYRFAPQHQFPCQLDDLRSALLWIEKHDDEYRFDLDRVGLYGYSAGGHLVSLLATLEDEPWNVLRPTTHWSEKDVRWSRLKNIRIVGVCAGGPPTDFQELPEENTMFSYFLGGTRKNRPEAYIAASPLAHVSQADPPIQIVHGDADLLVPLATSQVFRDKLRDNGVDVSLVTVPNSGHIVTFLSTSLTECVTNFFDERLRDSGNEASTRSN